MSAPADPRSSLIPRAWLDQIARRPAEGGPTGEVWAGRATRLLIECLDQWGLIVTGPAMTGWTAVAFPVEQDGRPAVLKVGWPHTESRAEHTALQLWGGHGAVRLLAADPHRGALLLERLDSDRTLLELDTFSACEVIGELLGRLQVPAPPTVPLLAEFVEPQLDRLAHARVPRRFAVRTRALAQDLFTDPTRVVLHTDLHYENVLAAEREPWLAIDPNPFAGHPGFEFQPLLRNRADDLGTGSALRWSVRRRLEIAADAAGVDREEARLWSLLHTGLQIAWAREADASSLQVALFKALED